METARKDLAEVVKRVVEREGEKARREEEEKMGEVGRMVRRRGGGYLVPVVPAGYTH